MILGGDYIFTINISPVLFKGIAYANVAGLDAQYGLYSAFMGCFVYCIFGSSKELD